MKILFKCLAKKAHINFISISHAEQRLKYAQFSVGEYSIVCRAIVAAAIAGAGAITVAVAASDVIIIIIRVVRLIVVMSVRSQWSGELVEIRFLDVLGSSGKVWRLRLFGRARLVGVLRAVGTCRRIW